MAISTYLATLKWGTAAATLSKEVDIKDFGDLGGEPEAIETTTLSDAAQTFIPGIKSSSAIAFTANYTSADYDSVDADSDTDLYYSLEFSDGSIFSWQGQHSVYVNGGGVNEAVNMTITVMPSTVIEKSDAED